MKVSAKGLDRTIHSFERAATELPEGSRAVVSKALLNIKTDWRRAWNGKFDHAPRIHLSISYEITKNGPLVVRGEVGPVDEPYNQGFLAPILEFGGLHSGPHPGGIPAAEAEAPRFEAAVDALLAKVDL